MTSSWVRRLAVLALAGCAGCGVAAPEIATLVSCSLHDVPLQLEQGVVIRGSAEKTCQSFASVLGAYRETFEDGWGRASLEEEGWTLRIRAGAEADSEGHTGVTYHHSRVVDLAEEGLETFPHELRHVQLGRGSDDHHGWCSNFAPWEEQVLGVDERGYLGCAK